MNLYFFILSYYFVLHVYIYMMCNPMCVVTVVTCVGPSVYLCGSMFMNPGKHECVCVGWGMHVRAHAEASSRAEATSLLIVFLFIC